MYSSPQVCADTRSAPGSAPSWQIGLFGHNNSCICGIANFEKLISGRGPQTLIISYFTAAVNSCYSLINRLHEPWTYFVNFPWENWVFTAILAEMLIITITTNWWEIENICNKKKTTKNFGTEGRQSGQAQNVLFSRGRCPGLFFLPTVNIGKRWFRIGSFEMRLT